MGQAEAALLDLPQVNIPVAHRFAPGVYLREVLIPAGTFVIGHEHKTEHFNVVLSGTVILFHGDGKIESISGPAIFVSKPGVRKVLFSWTDTRWTTIHPTEETDIEKLEDALIVKTAQWIEHFEKPCLSLA